MKTTRHFCQVFLTISMLTGILSACGPDPEPAPKFNFTVTNETGLTVKLSCPSCEAVNLAVGETKSFVTNTAFKDYSIQSVEPTTKTIEYRETSANTFTIAAYYWEIMYRVTGSAGTVMDVSFTNGEGGTSNFTNVPAGTNYQIKSFTGNLAQVSATRTSATGTIQLFIFHKDKQVKEGSGMGSTLTISATID